MKMKNEEDFYEFCKGKKVLYIATKNKEYIRVSQEIKILQETCEEYNVIAFNDKSYFKRVLKVFAKVLRSSLKKYDIIIIGFMAQMVWLAFSWRFKKKVVITDFFISVYDTLVFDRKKIKNGTYSANLLRWIDKYTIQNSNYLIVDTITHGNYFIEEFNAKKENIFVLYLEADEKFYHRMCIGKPERYKDKYLIVYFGSILPVQGVNVVLDAINILKGYKDIFFCIIGPIEGKFKKAETDNVEYISWLSQNDLAKYIGYADLCLAGHFSREVPKARRTIPGKAYIYEKMGKKMILGDSPANRELFKDDGKHFFVPLGDVNALSNKILQIKGRHYDV